MSDRSGTVTFSFLDAMSALWRPESCDMVEQAIRDALGTVRDVDVIVIDSRNIAGCKGLWVHLFVRTEEGSAAGFTFSLERTTLGLAIHVIDRPTIPEYLLSARVEVQPSWLASA